MFKMVKCPKCKAQTKQTNTYNKDNFVIRRRVCNNCGEVIFTKESIVLNWKQNRNEGDE
jgi:transcriptional regulator NrdR family protein